jgi:hypothetical protein
MGWARLATCKFLSQSCFHFGVRSGVVTPPWGDRAGCRASARGVTARLERNPHGPTFSLTRSHG